MASATAPCCKSALPPSTSIPPAATGSYTTLAGFNTYIAGPATSPKALLLIHDIFGLHPSTLRGADELAAALRCRVVLPDLFGGEYAAQAWYPPNEATLGLLRDWFARVGGYEAGAAAVPGVLRAAEEKLGVKEWGVVGCAAMVSGPSGVSFKAIAMCHPAPFDTDVARLVTAPVCLLPSEEETDESMEVLKGALGGEVVYQKFGKMVHGWMSGRADWDDASVRAGREVGYRMLIDFFQKRL